MSEEENISAEEWKKIVSDKEQENRSLRRELLLSQRMTLQAQMMVVDFQLRDLAKE